MIKCLAGDIMSRLRERFAFLYGNDLADRCLARLEMMAGRYGIGMGTPSAPAELWSEKDAFLIAYGDMIQDSTHPPLVTLKAFLDERLQGAVSAVHVLPFFPYSSDDGFSVIHYREVNPRLGKWKNIAALAEHFRLMGDLVLNHTSRQSGWFRDFALGIEPQRNFFIVADPKEDLSAVTRPRTSPLLHPVHTREGEKHVWTTFSEDQIDLNFAHPDVLFEFLDILLFYIFHGVRIIRLDAIAYLWKTIGTSCIHLPQTHEVVKVFRDFLRLVAPDTILLTETNVPHAENVSYFGDGDEAHMVYQFSLPPLILHALLREDASHLTRWAADLAPPPPGCTFFNFTASHDGVGVRPLQGLLPDIEFDALVQAVRERGGRISSKRNSDGTESAYELNISYFDALSFPEPDSTARHVDRFLCSQTIPLALQGIPGIYFNSLLAAHNDLPELHRTGHARAINRKRWDTREIESLLRNERSDTALVLQEYIRRLRIRSRHPAFHPDSPQRIHDLGPECFALERQSTDGAERILCIHNVTDRPIAVGLPDNAPRIDLFTETRHRAKSLKLAPYQTAWLSSSL